MSLNIKNLVDVVLRQTDYTEEKAIEKLKEHNNDIIAIVREYMCGSAIKKPNTIDTSNKSMNQQIYGEIRNLMDDAAKTYKAKKDLEERKKEYIAFMQAQAEQQAQAQQLQAQQAQAQQAQAQQAQAQQAQAQQAQAQQAQAQQQAQKEGAVEPSVSAEGENAEPAPISSERPA